MKFVARVRAIVATFVVASVCFAAQLDLENPKAGADKGDAEKEFRFGRTYFKGEGVPKDFQQACGLFEKSAAQGNPEATGFLAVIHERRPWKPVDAPRAVELYRKAAKAGSSLRTVQFGYFAGQRDRNSAQPRTSAWQLGSHEVSLVVRASRKFGQV